MEDLKQRIKIILVHPESSGNIGAVCRSMKTMGIKKLVIADPAEYDLNIIKYISVHAFDIFENALFCPSLDEALKDTVFSAGTTRRRGKRRKYRTFLPEELCEIIERTAGGEIGIVFGNEKYGLTDSQLNKCSISAVIPSSDEFPSLNLSHAVQIICYHIFRYGENSLSGKFFPSETADIERLAEDVTENLEHIGFFKISGKENSNIFLKDIFSRAMLCREEAEKVRSIFKKIEGLKQNTKK